LGASDIVEPTPQGTEGKEEAFKSVIALWRFIEVDIAVAAKPAALLLMVNLKVLVPPAAVGSVTTAIPIVKPVTVTVSLLAPRLIDFPDEVPVIVELITVTALGIASEGICNVTENVQEPPGLKLAPVNAKVEVPPNEEPLPHMSF
jgi:hypothetical protein